MRPGERSWVYITDYKYGYGEKGSFSFPSVPPATQLVYDVTMVTCEPPEEVSSRRCMCVEEGGVRGRGASATGKGRVRVVRQVV
jgi:hypothetical protein